MPPTDLVFFVETDGTVPVLMWLDQLDRPTQNKFMVRVDRLKQCGHELRRPEAAHLGDGIYELRVVHLHVHYRVLYFFHEGRAVLCHGLRKETEVPAADIARAVRRRQDFENDPDKHTYSEEGRP